MTIQGFFDKYNGKGIDFDGYYGFQCMDLAHQYAVEVCENDFSSAPAAKDVWNQNPEGYDKIKNSPDGIPQKGDIIVWGTGIGVYGHIAIFDHGDVNSFVSFDQNWPLNSLCHFQNHNYNGVLGWFHPRNNPATIPQPEEDIYKVKLQVVYQALCNRDPSDDEVKAWFEKNVTLAEVIDSVRSGDSTSVFKGVYDRNELLNAKLTESQKTIENIMLTNDTLAGQLKECQESPSTPPVSVKYTWKGLLDYLSKLLNE